MDFISLLITNPFSHWGLLIGGVIIFFLIGMLWYAPFTPTGKLWISYQKFEKDYKPNMVKVMGIQLLMTFIIVHTLLVIWLLLNDYSILTAFRHCGNMTMTGECPAKYMPEWLKLLLILKLYVGFVVTKEVGEWLFSRKPLQLILVEVGYYLTGIIIVSGLFMWIL